MLYFIRKLTFQKEETVMLYHWLGWISLAVCLLLLAKYIGRISNHKKVNQLLRKIHKPLGIAVIGIATMHGVISFIKNPKANIQSIMGLILLVLILILAGTFYARTKLKAKWFQIHQYFAILLGVIMVIHVIISFSQ